MIDLDVYFERIGYGGPRAPTLEVLRALHERHPAAIPFEAVDVLIGRGVDLAPAAVDAKLLAQRRGGYCFEHNGLFRRVLETLGFSVQPLLARVLWMAPPNAPPGPRTHMALQVTIDGELWLADVGFGGRVLTEPLRFAFDRRQATRHDPFRLTRTAGGARLEAELEAGWAPVYELSRERPEEMDFEAANWFTATHPASRFRNSLIVARTTLEARYALMDSRLTVRRPGQVPSRERLDADGLEEVLREVFGLPVHPDWRPALERAAASDGV